MTSDAPEQPGKLKYLHGFGNEHESEALPGALPVGRFSPQRVNYGLYAEQFSSSAFTAPRARNRRSWLYRIRPSVVQGDYQAWQHDRLRTAPITEVATPPDMLRWDPPLPRAYHWADGSAYVTHVELVRKARGAELPETFWTEPLMFYQSKPQTSFAPVAITPDELGDAWDGAKLHLPLVSTLNGARVGAPDAGQDMTFDFGQLLEHAARSRGLMAGTVVGSGTVANRGSPHGSSCLAEVRCLETIADGKPSTPFMSFGDRIEIEMRDAGGNSIFGRIDQRIKRYVPPG